MWRTELSDQSPTIAFSSCVLVYFPVSVRQSNAYLSMHARLYALTFCTPRPPSVFGWYCVGKLIRALFPCHRNLHSAVFNLLTCTCLNSRGMVCKGYRSRAKLTILYRWTLPENDIGRLAQASNSLTILSMSSLNCIMRRAPCLFSYPDT